ncbi:MAG: hypothetical protein AAB036_06300 [Elusimicrobiota bacterium]
MIVTSVIIASICAGLTGMMLMNHNVAARLVKSTANRKQAEALLSRVFSYWEASGIVCSPVPMMNCIPPSMVAPGRCNCTCTMPGGARVVVTDPDGTPGPPCILVATSSDP